MPRYSSVSARAGFPDAELEILDLWKRTRVFERSLTMRRDAPPYVFYEGPPTANGLPGLHHVLARSYKDVFARYKQMTGFSVARKAGWAQPVGDGSGRDGDPCRRRIVRGVQCGWR